MHPEIENLINMALADGEVTEKERGIILRKAESLGLDIDEVEMILDGRIALSKKESNTSQGLMPNNNKEGDLKKCPSCGAPVQSFTTKCSDCGHEFRNVKSSNSIEYLFKQIQEIEKNESFKPIDNTKSLRRFLSGNSLDEITKRHTIIDQVCNIISVFPVPNTKEDILEFLLLGLPQAKKKVKSFGNVNYFPEMKLKQVWLNKVEQVIMKARFSLKEDKKTLEEIEYYAKQINK